MSNDTSSSNRIGIILIASGIVALVIVALANALPDRMPPDPFENNEPREVTLEVDWHGQVAREQHILGQIGEEVVEVQTEGTVDGGTAWFWNHHTVGFEGDVFSLRSSQSFFGPVHCAVYVDEILIDENSSQQLEGCHVEGVIP